MCFVVAWPEWLFLFSQGMLQGKTTILAGDGTQTSL